MKFLSAMKSAATKAASSTKEAADGLNTERKRRALQRELGAIMHQQHRGGPVQDAAVADLLQQLDALDEMSEDSDGDAPEAS